MTRRVVFSTVFLAAAIGCGSSARPAATPVPARAVAPRTAHGDRLVMPTADRNIVSVREMSGTALDQGRAMQAMIAFQSLAEEMCSCSTPDCATVVSIKIEALGQAYGDLDAGAFSEAQQQDLMVAAMLMAECQTQVNRGAFR
jgi:hypothetical protein